MKKFLKKWLKEKLGIHALEAENIELKNRLESHRRFVNEMMDELKSHTRVDGDVGFRGQNTIILTGVHNRKAFVRFYDINEDEFQYFVEQMNHLKKYSLVRNIDAPYGFHGSFDL